MLSRGPRAWYVPGSTEDVMLSEISAHSVTQELEQLGDIFGKNTVIALVFILVFICVDMRRETLAAV